MKKKLFLSVLCLLTLMQASAQSTAHFYSNFNTQSTISDNPGNSLEDYFVTETSLKVNFTNQIHAIRYDHTGGILNISSTLQDYLLLDDSADTRNVDVVPIGTNLFLQVSYYRNIVNEPNKVKVRLAIIKFSGSNLVVVAENIIESTDPNFNSLYALDAIYDSTLNQFVICGMAVKELDYGTQNRKYAFVLTVDRSTLAPNKLMYYNSTNGPNTDYDVATRVVLTSTGNYYVTGGENVRKFALYDNMGMRNMLIDPVTLQYSAAGTWSQPLIVNSDDHEIGADMVEVNNTFIVLVNIAGGPAIIDVDPATGNFINPTSQYIGTYTAFGNSITQVNPSSNEVIVHGIQSQALTSSCYGAFNFQAEPFSAVIDVTSYPGTLISKEAYRTIIGNSVTGSDFWTWGDAYRPSGVLVPYFPIFYNKFATYTGASSDFGVIAPIHSPSTILNTKFIFTNAGGQTTCPTHDCGELIQSYDLLVPAYIHDTLSVKAGEELSDIVVLPMAPLDSDMCSNNYYKPTKPSSEPGSVNNLTAKTKTLIYPNPVTSEIKIELADNYSSNVSISMFDITGKKVADIYNGNNDRSEITYSVPTKIANGIYHIRISSKQEKTVTYKVNLLR